MDTVPPQFVPQLADIQAAYDRIKPYIHETPVMTCTTIDNLFGCKFFFKCETFQKGGAFKFRGAMNSVLVLSDEERRKGVVCHSSGNHAGAVALAGKTLRVDAHIVVPRDAPLCKVAAVKSYDGSLVFCEPTIEAREAACREIEERTGASFIAPYNHLPTIYGQGTISIEFLRQVPQLDAIIVPVSGGGMLGGNALAAKSLKPQLKVFGAEPTGTNDAADTARCKREGRLIAAAEAPKPKTLCDGLQARLGTLTWPLVRDHVNAILTFSEQDVIEAMRLIMTRMKIVVEPSGAAGLAAALAARRRGEDLGQNVGIVLCGGNVDLDVLFQHLETRVEGMG